MLRQREEVSRRNRATGHKRREGELTPDSEEGGLSLSGRPRIRRTGKDRELSQNHMPSHKKRGRRLSFKKRSLDLKESPAVKEKRGGYIEVIFRPKTCGKRRAEGGKAKGKLEGDRSVLEKRTGGGSNRGQTHFTAKR